MALKAFSLAKELLAAFALSRFCDASFEAPHSTLPGLPSAQSISAQWRLPMATPPNSRSLELDLRDLVRHMNTK
ncbi:unnamed protein product, partial [Lampetra planeri]